MNDSLKSIPESISTLERNIDLVAPFLPEVLVPAAHLEPVREVARLFPPANAGFECRLGGNPQRTDFAVAFDRDDGRKEHFAADRAGVVPAGVEPLCRGVWTNLRGFCREWSKEGSLLHAAVDRLWFEFDLDRPPGPAPIPRSFLSCRDWYSTSGDRRSPMERMDEDMERIYRILDILHGDAPKPELLGSVREFIASLPANARLFSMGTVLDRSPESIRLTVANLSAEQIPGFLQSRGRPVPKAAMQSITAPSPRKLPGVVVAMDVGRGVTPRVGLIPSCNGPDQASTEASWRVLLERLADCGLCTIEEKDALLAWPGYMLYDIEHDFPPPEGLSGAAAFGIALRWLLVRSLHHVKIDCFPDGSHAAKAYFGFLHRCVPLHASG